MQDFLCASLAGIIGRAPTHPLDTIKSVSFAHDGADPCSSSSSGGKVRSRTLSLRQGYRLIMQREGVRGFYRGLGIATVGSAPGVGTYMCTYEQSKKVLGSALGTPEEGSAVVHLCSGFGAETVSCVFWVPIDVVKERLQVQHPEVKGRYSGSWDGLQTILRNEGVAGLYKGYLSTLASFGPYSAVYFAAFEYFQALFRPFLCPKEGDASDTSTSSASSSFMLGVSAGACGNAVAGIVTNPLELVKTRLQIQRCILTVDGSKQRCTQYAYNYSSVAQGLASILKEEGIMGLTRGTASRVAYTVPNAALTMGLYQGLKQYVS